MSVLISVALLYYGVRNILRIKIYFSALSGRLNTMPKKVRRSLYSTASTERNLST